jgi:hypothetical protein
MQISKMQHSRNESEKIPKKAPKQAREISAFFSLVIDETFEKLPTELTPTTIRCFRKGCFGIISSAIELDKNEIYWKCSECVNSGTITGL